MKYGLWISINFQSNSRNEISETLLLNFLLEACTFSTIYTSYVYGKN
jgi:hypothetical protein